MMQLIYFSVSAILLFLAHYFVLYIFNSYFNLTGNGFFVLGFILILLFISAVLSSYLIHKKDNFFSRCYYFVSATWVGILINFLLAFVASILLKFLLPNIFIDNSYVLYLSLAITLILSVYGLINAFNPKINNYEVEIKDLPSYWENKTIVQISDVHIGPIYREKFFSSVIKKINKLEPEAVFITGDFFDGMESDFSWLHHPLSKIKTKKGIYYSFGNHDLYLGFNKVTKLLRGGPAIVLDNKMKVVEGLQIIGINYSFNKDFDLYKAILNQVSYDKLKPSILLFHEPKNVKLAKDAGINLQLSGHTHDGQLFPFNFVAKFAYKGYNVGLFKKGTFSLIVNRGLGTWGPPMRTVGRGEISKIKLIKL